MVLPGRHIRHTRYMKVVTAMKKRLIKAAKNTYYIDGYAKVGIYVLDNGKVCLIDCGAGSNAGEHIDNVLMEEGWEPEMILITHNHVDHIAGVGYMQRKYGCRVLSDYGELFLYEYPELEPVLMYGGNPYKELDGICHREKVSGVECIDSSELPEGFEIANIDGHAEAQRAIKTPDDVWFLGDGLVSPHTINEYHIAYIYDVGNHLKAIDTIESLEGRLFIPCHSEPVADVTGLAKLNRDKILDILDNIMEICRKPVTMEDILAELFRRYDVVVGHTTYIVAMSTIKSYMTYLLDKGRVKYSIDDYKQKWTICERKEKNEL